MAMLGEALMFHLTYMAEMNRHFGGSERSKLSLEILEMVRQVGAAAYEQAADFLSLCDERIERHFNDLGASLVTRRSRNHLRDHWSGNAKFSFEQGEFSCGAWITSVPEIKVSLPNDACGALIPWLWLKGGKKSEEFIWNALKGKARSRSGEGLINDRGAIALSLIPVLRSGLGSFEAARDPLLDQLSDSLKIIGRSELGLLANYAAHQT